MRISTRLEPRPETAPIGGLAGSTAVTGTGTIEIGKMLGGFVRRGRPASRVWDQLRPAPD